MRNFFLSQKKILAISLIGIFLFFLGVEIAVAVGPGEGICPGGEYCLPNPLGETTDITGLITKIADFLVVKIFTPVIGLLAILAGFRFVTAQGNEEKIKKARQNLIWTITGLVVVYGARVLIDFIQVTLGVPGATSEWENIYSNIIGFLNQIIVIIFALATIYFVWGVAEYVRSAGNEKALEQGKRHMIYGIIGMTIMGGVWGIVQLILSSLEL